MYLVGMHITTEPRDQLLYLQDIVMHVKSDESTWHTTTTTTTKCRVTMQPPTKRNAPFWCNIKFLTYIPGGVQRIASVA